MKFVVDSITKNSGRLGRLIKNETELKTPLVLLYTKVGSIPHISREVFELLTTESQGIQLPIQTTLPFVDSLQAFDGGISAFVGLEPAVSYISIRDTAVPSESTLKKDSVVLKSRAQTHTITANIFMDFVSCAKPDIFHTLCDGVTDKESANKRLLNSVARSDNFFQTCVRRYKESPALSETMLIASVPGGYSEQYRKDAIELLDKYENQDTIAGYFLDGFHMNSSSASDVDHNKVCEIVKYCNGLLADQKLKVMFGAYTPALLIQLIRLNVDVFDTTYAYLATTKNLALTFNLNYDQADSEGEQSFVIDLKDPQYKDQFIPYVRNCTCLACRKYTRAYTHHLLNTSELLGPILLMIHNAHHYLEFFKVIRQCMANDALAQLEAFMKQQEETHATRLITQVQEPNEAISNKKQKIIENVEQ